MTTSTGTGSKTTAVPAREVLLSQNGGIVAVHDFDGDLARLSLTALNDPAAGLVAFQVRPGTRRAAWLPADLHTALGADQGLTGWGRPGEGDWAQVTVAALAQRIGHIFVLDAWLLTPALLQDLLLNLQATGAALWLLGRGALSDDHRAVLDNWVCDLTDPRTFLTAWSDRTDLIIEPGQRRRMPPADAPDAPITDDWPLHLPDTDFTTFRAACRDTLTDAQFTVVDAHLHDVATTGRAWLAAHLLRHSATDEETVARHLHQVWQDSATVPHYVTAIRAYQVAAFSLGWFLQVDIDQLLGTGNVSPRRAARTPALWARLSGYASPHRGAVCALTGAGIDIADQGNILLESVTDAGRTVILPTGRRVHIEDGAHHHVHAQKLARLLHGAASDDVLITDPDGRPLAERTIADVLTTARLELGLNLTGLRAERRTPTGDRWYTRWGISIQETDMTTHQPPRLARDRIRDRRLELRLSERDVAAKLGVSTAVVRSVEAGRVDADLTLGQLAKLGHILALDLAEMLDHQPATRPSHGNAAPACAGEDVAQVGSLLADVRVLVPIDGLADALNWDLARVHTALEGLDAALRPAGLRVHRLHHDVRIVRTITTLEPKTLENMWRIHLARRSLTIAQARLLKHIRDGVVPLASNKDTQKVRLPELRNACLIAAAPAEAGSTAKWELAQDVRFSLLLDELPTSADVNAPARPVPAHRLKPSRP